MRIAVLASGSGTLLEAIVASGIEVSLVVVDRECGAQSIAATAGIDCELLLRDSYGPAFDREGYTAKLEGLLDEKDIGLVVMAWFVTILAASAYERFGGRVLNTHPALLPSFKGWHAVEEALGYGVKVTGCTVHVATADVDAGPILAQAAVEVFGDDTVESLHERIKQVERTIYPAAIKDYVKALEAERKS